MLNLVIPEGQYFRKVDYVADSLRTAILLRRIPAGTRITEQQIQEVLKVSSSPVREAIKQLEAEGLLEERPQGGAKITELDIGDIKELYSVHSLLQAAAVQIATPKLSDTDFCEAEKLHNEMKKLVRGEIDVDRLRVLNYRLHLVLCGLNVYPWVTRAISALWVRFPTRSAWQVKGVPRLVISQHERMISAVRKRDAVLAGKLMKKHLEFSGKFYSRQLHGERRIRH
jgi:DNA-binding GntR family transcriptional regulator